MNVEKWRSSRSVETFTDADLLKPNARPRKRFPIRRKNFQKQSPLHWPKPMETNSRLAPRVSRCRETAGFCWLQAKGHPQAGRRMLKRRSKKAAAFPHANSSSTPPTRVLGSDSPSSGKPSRSSFYYTNEFQWKRTAAKRQG